MFRTSHKLAGLGATLAGVLITGFSMPAVAGENGPELSVGSVAFNVADFARSEKFYADVLGFVRVGTYPPRWTGRAH